MGIGALSGEITQLPNSFMKVFGGVFLLFPVLHPVRGVGSSLTLRAAVRLASPLGSVLELFTSSV